MTSTSFPVYAGMRSGSPGISAAVRNVAAALAYPETYGAAADGATDDTAALEKWVASGKALGLKPGKTYIQSQPLTLSTQGQKLYGQGGTLKRAAQTSTTTTQSFTPNSTASAVVADPTQFKVGQWVSPCKRVAGVVTVAGAKATGTYTVTAAAPAVFTAVTPATHGLVLGDQITFTNSGGALPTGLTAGTVYYVIAAGFTTSTFQVGATAQSTVGVTTSDTGSGTQTYNPQGSQLQLTAHQLANVDQVMFSWTGTAPTGVVANTIYFVSRSVNPNSFQVATTTGGLALTITAGSGVLTVTQQVTYFGNPKQITSINGTTVTVGAPWDFDTVSAVVNTFPNPGYQLATVTLTQNWFQMFLGNDDQEINGVIFDGNSTNWPGLKSSVQSVNCFQVKNPLIHHCHFINTVGDAAGTNGCQGATFAHNRIENCSGRGFVLGASNAPVFPDIGTKVIHNYFLNTSTDPNGSLSANNAGSDHDGAVDYSAGGADSLIQGNYIDQTLAASGHAVGIGGLGSSTANGAKIRDNSINNCSTNGISAPLKGLGGTQLSIVGNHVSNCGQSVVGIAKVTVADNRFIESSLTIQGAQSGFITPVPNKVTVSGNHFESALTVLNLINLTSLGSNLVVSLVNILGNRCYGGARGIFVQSGVPPNQNDTIVISDNLVSGHQNRGIDTDTSSNCRIYGNTVIAGGPLPAQTCTITIAAPGVVTLASHGFIAGNGVVFSTTGALPTGLTAGTNYFVIPVDANTFQVSATSNGGPITTTGSQSGTQSVARLQTLGSSDGISVNGANCEIRGNRIDYTANGNNAIHVDVSAMGALVENNRILVVPSSLTKSIRDDAGSTVVRTDTCGITSGSATVTDVSCLATDLGRVVTSAGNITTGTIIVAPILPGVSFTLSRPAIGTNASATATIPVGSRVDAGCATVSGSAIVVDANVLGTDLFAAVTGTGSGAFGNTIVAVPPAIAAVTCTITLAAPGVISLSPVVAHGFSIGDPVQFTTTGALPTGLAAATTYYVSATGFGANAFSVAATPSGTAITTSGSQSGVQTVARIASFRMAMVSESTASNSLTITTPGTVVRNNMMNKPPSYNGTGEHYGNQVSGGPLTGVATLVAGTVTVTCPEIQYGDNVLLTRMTPLGTAVGELSLGVIANVGFTSASFVINSVQPGTPGSLQTGDISTVRWEIVH